MNDNSEDTIRTLIAQVDRELEKIDKSIKEIDDIIDKDINALIADYGKQLSAEIFAELKAKHYPELKSKKLDSFTRAKDKLTLIKQELQSTLRNPAA